MEMVNVNSNNNNGEEEEHQNKDKQYLLSSYDVDENPSTTLNFGGPTSTINDEKDRESSTNDDAEEVLRKKRFCFFTSMMCCVLAFSITGIVVGLLYSSSPSPSLPADDEDVLFNDSQLHHNNNQNNNNNVSRPSSTLVLTRPPITHPLIPSQSPTTAQPTPFPVNYCPQHPDNFSSFVFNDESPIVVSSNTLNFGTDVEAQLLQTCSSSIGSSIHSSSTSSSGSYGGRGIWYVLDGPGAVVIASTCNFFSPANFDTQLSIFISTSPTCIDGLLCVTTDDNSCEFSNASRTSWFAEQGRTYFILVHGARLNEFGDFTLSLELAPIGTCDAAITLPVVQQQEPVIGTLLGSTLSMDPCSAGVVGRGGEIWYQVSVPTGHWLMASTCYNVNEFPPRLALYMGDCGNLQCATPMHYQQDNDCGSGSSLTWYATSNEVYYILVYKTNYLPGVTFGITVEEFEPPVNDNCTNAIELQPNGSISYGSTLRATYIRWQAERLGCNVTYSHPGVWYSVRGTGTTLTASTCDDATNFDTKITVYSAATTNIDQISCNDGLYCIAGNDQWCGYQSSVAWNSTLDNFYFILVHGSEDGIAPSIGNFGLAVYEFTPTINNVCRDAIGPLQVDSSVVTYGSTHTASVDRIHSVCADGIGNVAPGVWYTVIGTGEGIRASTCGSETDFDTRITIYEYTGSSTCDDYSSLQCLISDDNGCGFQSQVYWPSIEGQLYYILVNGNLFSSFGDFELHVSSYDPETINDFCANSLYAGIGMLNIGSTRNATFDGAETCVVPNTAPGVWYRIYGTGNRMIASTCHVVTDYDTRLSVFGGQCTELACIAGNDDSIDDMNNDDCGASGSSRVSWLSNAGELYNILVHGWGFRTGVFGLTIEDAMPSVSNDFCVGASSIRGSSNSAEGTTATILRRQGLTIDATVDNVPVCGDIRANGRGIWYRGRAHSNSSVITVSTCNSETTFDTQISVFRGQCGNLECVGGNNDDPRCDYNNKGSTVTFFLSQYEETFYVLVHDASAEDTGEFTLSLQERPSPLIVNDFCSDAIFIPVIVTSEVDDAESLPSLPAATASTTTTESDFVITGSTIGSSYDNVGTCVVPNTSPGVWYVVIGTGHVLRATTCHIETDFDTRITIFQMLRGAGGEGVANCLRSLECITGNDDTSIARTVRSFEIIEAQEQGTTSDTEENSCGAQSTASWFSVAGEKFYILVHGFDAHVGNFALSVEEILLSGQ